MKLLVLHGPNLNLHGQRTVHLGFAPAEKIQVGAVQHKKLHFTSVPAQFHMT